MRTNHSTSVQTLGGHEASSDTSLRNNFNCDVTCSCLNVQNIGEGGVTVLNMHSSTALSFFLCCLPLGWSQASLGGLEGGVVWEG